MAAKLALKHISVVTTEGYAGSPGGAQAKFLAEVGKEEQKRNLDVLVEEMTNYRNGIRPSGPHAKNLLEFFDTVDGKLTDEQRAAPKSSSPTRSCAACCPSGRRPCIWG